MPNDKNKFKINKISNSYPFIQVAAADQGAIVLDYYGYVKEASDLSNFYLRESKQNSILFKSIAFGDTFLLLGIDNYLWESKIHYLSKIEEINNVKSFCCGQKFSFAICEDNSVWARGNNGLGQLGLGDIHYKPQFTPLKLDKIITQIDCGRNHSLFLDHFQNVYSCGANYYGQLGIGNTKEFTSELILIESLSFITKLSCRIDCSFCVDVNGNLFTFGDNIYWFPTLVKIPPVQFISNGYCIHTVIYDINGDFWYSGGPDDLGTFEKMENMNFIDNDNINSIKCSSNKNNTVFEFVDNLRKEYVSE